MTELRSPLQAHIVQLLVTPGEAVQQGQLLLVLEAMKMEHEVCAPGAAQVLELFCAAGDTVQAGDVLALLDLTQAQKPAAPLASSKAPKPAPSAIPTTSSYPTIAKYDSPDTDADTDADVQARPDLARVQSRHAFTLDASRPEAMAKRHRRPDRR